MDDRKGLRVRSVKTGITEKGLILGLWSPGLAGWVGFA